jgi:hypothetical protein
MPRPERTYTASNIPEFLEIVEKVAREWFTKEKTWGPWFRGQAELELAVKTNSLPLSASH